MWRPLRHGAIAAVILCCEGAFAQDLALVGSQPTLQSRSSLAGDTEDPAPQIDANAKGALELPWPFPAPTSSGPILVSPLPAYSSQGGASRWGRGWTEPYFVETEALEGAPSALWFKSKLHTPWGRFIQGADGDWYPTGMTGAIRARKCLVRPGSAPPTGSSPCASDRTPFGVGATTLEFYLPGHVLVRFEPDSYDAFTGHLFRWRVREAFDDHGNTTKYLWEQTSSYSSRLQQVAYGLNAQAVRIVFHYAPWPGSVISGGRRGLEPSLNSVVDYLRVYRGSQLLETQTLIYAERDRFWYPVLEKVERTSGVNRRTVTFEHYPLSRNVKTRVDRGTILNRNSVLNAVPMDIDGDGDTDLVNFPPRLSRAYKVELESNPSVTWRPNPIRSTTSCPWNHLAEHRPNEVNLVGRFERGLALRMLRLGYQSCSSERPPAPGDICLTAKVCSTAGTVVGNVKVPLNPAFSPPNLAAARWIDIDRDARPDLVVFGSESAIGVSPRHEVHVFRATVRRGEIFPETFGPHEILHETSGSVRVEPGASHQVLDYNADGLPDLIEVTRGNCGDHVLARLFVHLGTGDPLGFLPRISEVVSHSPGRETSCARWLAERHHTSCIEVASDGSVRPPRPAGYSVGILKDLDGDGLPDYVGSCTSGLEVRYRRTSFNDGVAETIDYGRNGITVDTLTRVAAIGEFFSRANPSVASFLLPRNQPGVIDDENGPGPVPQDTSWLAMGWGTFRDGLMKGMTVANGHTLRFDYSVDQESRTALLKAVRPIYRGGRGNRGPSEGRTFAYERPYYDPRTHRLWGHQKVTACVSGERPCEIVEYEYDADEEGIPRVVARYGASTYVVPWQQWEYEKSTAPVPFRRPNLHKVGWKSANTIRVGTTSWLSYGTPDSQCGAHAMGSEISPSSTKTQNEHGDIDQVMCYRRPALFSEWLQVDPTEVMTSEVATDRTTRRSTRHIEYWGVGTAFDYGRLRADWTDTSHSVSPVGACTPIDIVENRRVHSLHPSASIGYPMSLGSAGLSPITLERREDAPELVSKVAFPDGRTIEVLTWDPVHVAPTEVVLNGYEHIHVEYDARGRIQRRWSSQRGEDRSAPGLERWFHDGTEDGVDIVESAVRVGSNAFRRDITLSGAAGGLAISGRMERHESGLVWHWSPMTLREESSWNSQGLTERLPQLTTSAQVPPTPVMGSPGARTLSLASLSSMTNLLGWSWTTPSGGGRTVDKTTDRRDDLSIGLRANDLLFTTRRASQRTNAIAATETVEVYLSGLVKRRRRGGAIATYTYYPSGDPRRIEIQEGAAHFTIAFDADLAGRLHALHRSDVGGFKRCYHGAFADTIEWIDRDSVPYRTEKVVRDPLGRPRSIEHSLPSGAQKTYSYAWGCENLEPQKRHSGCLGKLSGLSGPNYARSTSFDTLGRPEWSRLVLGSQSAEVSTTYDGGGPPRTVAISPSLGPLSSSRFSLLLTHDRDEVGGGRGLSARMGQSRIQFGISRQPHRTKVETPVGEMTRGFHPSTSEEIEEEWFTGTFQAKHRVDESKAGFNSAETYEWNRFGAGAHASIERNRRFAYDENQRLRSVSGSGRMEGYRYEPDGRPWRIEHGSATRTWQHSGLTRRSSDGFSLSRDSSGRVTSQTRMDGVNASALTYQYGADGQVETVQAGGRTLTLIHAEDGAYLGALEGDTLVDEEGMGGLTGNRWPVRIDGRSIGWIKWGSGVGPTLRFEPLVADTRGSSFLINGETPLEPSAFGELTDASVRARSLDSAFVGRRWSAPLGVITMPYRSYVPEAGEFMAPDPLNFTSPENCVSDLAQCFPFQYVFNDPVSFADTTGLSEEERSVWHLDPVTIGPVRRPLDVPDGTSRGGASRGATLTYRERDHIDFGMWPSGYSYTEEHVVGRIVDGVTAEKAMYLLQSNPNEYFPFYVEGKDGQQDPSIAEGAELELKWTRWPFDNGNYVKVSNVTATGFAFDTLPGHFEGPGSNIHFSTFESNGLVVLRQAGYAPLAGPLNSTFAGILAAKVVWQIQAARLAAIAGSQRTCGP